MLSININIQLLFVFSETGVELELLEEMPFLEWLANSYKNFGANLEIVTDRSQEGSQFVRGFGGIRGILRYKVDFQSMQCEDLDDEESTIFSRLCNPSL